jgi:hypothetical protein
MGKKKIVVAVGETGERIGEDHQNARLNNEQVDRIRDLHEGFGLTYTQLAAMYSVTKSCIAGICQYRRYVSTPFGFKTLELELDDGN